MFVLFVFVCNCNYTQIFFFLRFIVLPCTCGHRWDSCGYNCVFFFVGATTIDIDDTPTNQSSSKSRKVSRNGVHGGESERTRVEVPKDGDQLKLSELFNVLRVKKPQEQTPQETQVRRVRSRHYSESDSDSSSNSELEDVRSCSTALSMTESELDTRRLDSPQHIESPTLKMVASAQESQNIRRSTPNDKQDASMCKIEVTHPVPAPRSPRSGKRRQVDDDKAEDKLPPVPKPRSPVPKRKNGNVGINIEKDISNSDIQNVDSSSIHSNLSAHVARTKESLEIKYEVEKSRSQNSLNTTADETELVVRPKVRDNKDRQSAENTCKDTNNLEKLKSHSEHFQKSENGLDKFSNQNGKTPRSSENLSRSLNRNVRTRTDSDSNASSNSAEIIQSNSGEELIVPRAGSPYSFSMDSLPSSHPSPVPCRVSITSVQESSDNESVSRASQKDGSETSGSESVQKERIQEDFVVEEISQVRFRRVSRGQIAPGPLAKLQKSPKRSK